ncbi:MAG: CPBP family intramembrane metalloprotease [Thermoanaerobaculia bacterium]|nr:CPBP family intramembrane metalloprotease [Thermoanaerobaculia bacterium]
MTFDLNLTPFDWIVVAYFALALPLLGVRSVRRVRQRVADGDPNARISFYRQLVAEQWIKSAILLFGWWWLARPLEGLGLTWPRNNGAVAAWGLCLLGLVGLALQIRAIITSESFREQVREQFARSSNEVGNLTPSNERELHWFWALSVTAGINEELIFRGFLMAIFWNLGGPVLAVAASTAIFAVCHAYQPSHLPKVAGIGLTMALLYVLGGSVFPLMILHAAIDLAAGWMSWRLSNESPEATDPHLHSAPA